MSAEKRRSADAAEWIRVELEEPVEATLYPVQVRGTFRVLPAADVLYRLVEARARVMVLEGE